MKLKLLFFMGILSVLCNTMNGQNTAPVFQVPPPNRTDCPGYPATNIQYQVTDSNTPAPLLVVSASASGAQVVTFDYRQDPTGILRSIDVIPVAPFVQGIVTVTITLSDVGFPKPNLSTTATFTVNFEDITPPLITQSLPFPLTENISAAAGCQFTVPDYTGFISATDYCGDAIITQSPPAGTVLNVSHDDVATVMLTATDDYGNFSTTSFNVTLKDVTPPMVITKNKTVQLDAFGNASIIVADINDGSSDNCTIDTITVSPNSFTCVNLGTNTVTLTVTDIAGNVATNTATVTVEDNIAPDITCAADVVVSNDLGQCGANVTVISPTSTDNCSVVSLINNFNGTADASGVYPVGLTTVTWTATDAAGNSSTCMQTVTVNDTQAPTVITQNITVDLDSSGNVNITASQIDNGSTDNCTIASRVLDITSFNCSNLGNNTVQLTVTDAAGNSAIGSATVTVEDNIAPAIIAPADITVSNDPGQCGASVTVTSPTPTDNCAVVTLINDFNGTANASGVYPVGTTTVTWTATDGSGNSSTATQRVTVNDTEAPSITCAANVVVGNDSGVCGAVVTLTAPVVTDNCSTITPSGVRSDSLALSAVYPVGTTSVTWTATDAAGNSSTCMQTVTVNDTEAPTVITQNITVELNSSGNVSITSSQIDNGSTDNCAVASRALDISSFTCANLGANTVVLTVTDVNGNSATGSAIVTVEDNIDPTITTDGNHEVSNDPGQCGAAVTVVTTAADNCSVVTLINDFNGTNDASDVYPVGTTTITWTATDSSGNSSTATQDVKVNDTEAPTFTSPFPDLVVNNDPGFCSYATNQLPVPSVTDNCTPFSGIVTVDPATIPVSAGPDHIPSIVTWTATDNYGNTVTATQSVLVQDLELPIMRTKDITLYYDANGQIIITPEDIDNGSTDNSGTDCFTKYVVPNILYCGDKGDNSVILTGTDLWGNQHYKEATVTAVDNTNPTISAPAAITLNTNTGCTWVGALVSPTTADNCTVVSVTNDAPAALPLGDTTVTWTVTDASGNTASTTQLVTVNDVEKPVAIAKLGVVVELDAMGVATITGTDIDNGSTDNCGIDTKTVSPSSFTCSNVGANVVTLTVKDASGNVSTIDTIVTVQDTTAPTIVTQAYTAQLNAAGTVSILASNVNNGSSDSCGIKTMTVSPSTFTCANVGANTVTLTVTDNNNNVSTGTAIVTVVDSVLPVVVTKPYTLQLNAAGTATLMASDVNNGSSDSCGIKTMTISKSAFTCSDAGANTVTLTVTDNNDNVQTGTATVTVVDSVLPIAITKPITVQLSAAGSVTIVAADVNNGSTDNCAIASYTLSKSTFTCSDIGVTTITLTATDTSGNVALPVNALVTVQDVTAPTVNTKNITVQLNAAGIASIVPADVNNVSTDACGIASYSLDKTTFNCSNVGTNTVTLTVIDINGNVSSNTAVVTVQDTVKPVVLTRNITVQLSALGSVTILTSDIDNGSTDNCAIVSYALSKSTFDCTNVGSNTIQLTVTDAAGNVSLPVNATVTVQDKVVPTVITKNITVQLNAAGTVTITAADVNNGSSDVCGAVTLAISKSTFTCANVGANVITLTVTDVNGNINQGFATVTVVDNIIPVITSNGNKTANADLGECSAIVTVSATATDNCSVGSPMGVRSDAKPLAAAYPVGTTTITWNVTDVNGNAAVAVTQTVIVTDTQKPVITANGNKFVTNDLDRCGALVAVSATATDNCTVGSPIATRSDALAINAPFAVGTTTITWNVSDINGNAATPVVQTVIVRDLQIPVINGTVVSIDANTDATACAATVSITAPTASDNCTVGTPVGTRSDNLALTALYPIGTTTITWKVTDVNGNVALPTTTTVKVKDATAPTVITKPITIMLNVSGVASIVPADVNNGSNDACGIASYSLDRTSFSCSDTGAAKTVTLTVIDIHGNVASASALVTVTEPIIPIALTRNITVQLNAAGTVSILPSDINNGSTDNCAIVSYSLSKSTFDCTNVGQNIITLTATDASGNNSIPVNATVIVQDKVAPVVVTQSYTAQLNDAGTVTITAANVDNGSSDACNPVTLAISKSTFTCANVGSNVITLTVTDVNGNSAQGFATVNVVDSVKPVVVAKDIELVLDGASVSITPEDVFVSATDACGVDVHSYTLSRDTFTIVDVLNSPVTVTLSVTDVNGNVGTDDFLVTFPTLPTVANEVITPNADGTNDTWVIDNITNHPKSIVRVYNAWGSLVFSAVNYQNDWDGKINGNDISLPDGGSYYYQVDLEGNGTINNQGWLYITRQ